MRLYHFTCDDGARGIRADQIIKPGMDSLVWLADTPTTPPPTGAFGHPLGLTMRATRCDRTVWRLTILDAETIATPWQRVRHLFAADWVDRLEQAPGALPAHWWVAPRPITEWWLDRAPRPGLGA